MIHIEKNQPVPDNINLLVFSPTGDYNDNDLIECCGTDNLEKPAISFQAQFIKYGGLVYHFNGPKELGDAILKVDSESPHSAASYVRMSNELLRQMNAGDLEPDSLNQAMADEQDKMQNIIDNPVDENLSTSTPETLLDSETDTTIVSPILDTNTSTTTPSIIDFDTQESTTTDSFSTTTPQILEEIIPLNTDTTTTTPSILEEIQNASSTVSDIVAMAKKIKRKNKV